MKKAIEFIKPLTAEEKSKVALETKSVVANLPESYKVNAVEEKVQEEISFPLPSLTVRKRAINATRKGLIKESEIESILKNTDAPVSKVEDLLLELVIGKKNYLPAYFLEVGAQQVKAVCKIMTHGVDYEGNNGDWSGTGILVGENILLTNHHVLNSTDVAQNATCVFNFQIDSNKQIQQTKEFTLDPNRLFITSPVTDRDNNGQEKKGLDYTFVWIKGEPAKEFGFIPLNRSSFNVLEGENANIIQHPNGLPKVVALQDNTVTEQDLLVIHYSTDTEPGSSGAIVLNNEWKPIALHHASTVNGNRVAPGDPQYINEGIKFSAIAAHIEQRSQQPEYAKSATEVLKLFHDVDTTMGFFGGLGRNVPPETIGVEKVVNSYKGEDDDIDVGFWNIEWFNKRFTDKVEKVAEVVVNMNLDVWGFSEASLEATQELVKVLRQRYNLDYDCLGSEPDASGEKQTNTVLWNKETVTVKKIEWTEEVKDWFLTDSRNFDDLGLGLEAVHGPIFPRVAQPYLVTANKRSGNKEPFAFNFLPLHLKAMSEGSLRRKMASRIIGAAIDTMRSKEVFDHDWIVGGDMNAPLATNDFQTLLPGMTPLSATDEADGSFSYLKQPKSLIDHIFVSKELNKTYGQGNYFIVAEEKGIPNYVKEISDHRPVLVRLSLLETAGEERKANKENVEKLITKLKGKVAPKPEIASELKKEFTTQLRITQGTLEVSNIL